MKKIRSILFALLTLSISASAQTQDEINQAIFDRVYQAVAPKADLPMPDLVVAIAEQFLGTPYVASTLEETPEQLRVFLDKTDCILFVEMCSCFALTVKSDKPVVLAGSMRPSNAISADGPANLYNAVAAAVSPNTRGYGVLCCMNNQLLDAKTVIKTHTIDCDTFEGGPSGIIGYIYNGEAHMLQTPNNKHTINSVFDVTKLDRLPQVGIVYGYANASALPMQAFVDAKFDGIVLAGVGDGNFYKDVFDVAVKAQNQGIQIVRSSRCPTGPTCLNSEVDDEKYHFVAALDLNPQKARVLLMLALTKTHDWQEIQQFFKEY